MLKIYKFENNARNFAAKYAPYTNVVGFARSMIALGTILTLLLNPVDTLFVRKITGSFISPILQSDLSSKISFFYLFGKEHLAVMKFCAIICLLLVISGYFMKLSALLHWWITFSFLHSAAIIDGGDQIAAIISFLLIPVCLFDNRKNHWYKKIKQPRIGNLISICFIYIIRLQVAIIYFHAAVGKFDNTEWANGTALYYWLNHSLFGFPSYLEFTNYFLKNSIVVSALTYGVLILELCMFLALFASMRYRKKVLVIALSFHFLIILYHGIFSFFFSIGGAAILYLYPTYKNYNKSNLNMIKLKFARKAPAAAPIQSV
jgi:antimicrobial peptide system SdpB family protein